jgi:NadR type nicotinamide-nucleotide adenylyltransferase
MRSLRIILFGSECTGKTTLARRLAERFVAPWAEEFVREFYDRKGYDPEFADLDPIARGQIASEEEAEARADRVVFFDASLLSTVVYAHHYYGRCPAWIEHEAEARLGDLYLLCEIDCPWSADSMRDRGERREEMQALFREALVSRGVRVEALTGD